MAKISALVADHAGRLGQPVSPELVLQVCNRAARADGAALSIGSNPEQQGTSVCAVGELGQRLEELQFTLGEGPRRRSLLSGGPVLVPDLTAEHVLELWPVFAPAAARAGIRAHFAFPLQAGAIKIGVLELCRRMPGLLSPEELADATAYADLALDLMLAGQQTALGPDEFDWLTAPAVGARAEVHQATGMVSVQLGVSLADALARLRAYAYAHDQSLAEVARRVVSRQLRLSPDEPGPGRPGASAEPDP